MTRGFKFLLPCFPNSSGLLPEPVRQPLLSLNCCHQDVLSLQQQGKLRDIYAISYSEYIHILLRAVLWEDYTLLYFSACGLHKIWWVKVSSTAHFPMLQLSPVFLLHHSSSPSSMHHRRLAHCDTGSACVAGVTTGRCSQWADGSLEAISTPRQHNCRGSEH